MDVAMICDFYQGYDNFGSFHGRCLANFCENIDIAFVDVTVKVTMADVIVICIADADVMRCMRCYSARWQIFLPCFCVVHHRTTEFIAGYVG